jgi:hypothetical protein
MSDQGLRQGLFCPICERRIAFIWIWRDPDSDRIRIFCDECSRLPEYHHLPRPERSIYSLEGFQRFAGARLLNHVMGKERGKRDGEGQ